MIFKDETLLSVGMVSMAIGILIGRFLHYEYSGFSVTDFLEGVLIGISLVMNLTYLIRIRSKEKDAKLSFIKEIGQRFFEKIEDKLMERICSIDDLELKKLTEGKTVPHVVAGLLETCNLFDLGPPALIWVAVSIIAEKYAEVGLDAACKTWKESKEKVNKNENKCGWGKSVCALKFDPHHQFNKLNMKQSGLKAQRSRVRCFAGIAD